MSRKILLLMVDELKDFLLCISGPKIVTSSYFRVPIPKNKYPKNILLTSRIIGAVCSQHFQLARFIGFSFYCQTPSPTPPLRPFLIP
jgi:hypothetical protein